MELRAGGATMEHILTFRLGDMAPFSGRDLARLLSCITGLWNRQSGPPRGPCGQPNEGVISSLCDEPLIWTWAGNLKFGGVQPQGPKLEQ